MTVYMYAYNVLLTNTCNMYEIKILLLLLLLLLYYYLLDRHSRSSDIDETHIIRHSPYYSETQFKQLISNKADIYILLLTVFKCSECV